MSQRFRVLTLNTWLLRLPFEIELAPHVTERASLLPGLVRNTNADIVLCQEVWDSKLRRQLKQEFADHGYLYEASASPNLRSSLRGAPNGAFASMGLVFPFSLASISPMGSEAGSLLALSGGTFAALAAGSLALDRVRKTMGNGLQIFSRFKLSESVDVMPFSTWTRSDEVFIAKGVIRVKARVPGLGWIDVYNSHLGAVSYDPRKGEYDSGHCERRRQQAGELAGFIHRTRSSEFAVLGVDLNATPCQTSGGETRPTHEHELFSSRAGNLGFIDTFEASGSGGDKGHTDHGGNPYKRSGYFRNSPDARIDYIFASRSNEVRPTKSCVTFEQSLTDLLGVPANGAPLPPRISDHYGVITEFEVRRPATGAQR
jgi:endonuclease/exonuclease/phosphatase family metal-dependent hydrolase